MDRGHDPERDLVQAYADVVFDLPSELRRELVDWGTERGVSEITMARKILEAELNSHREGR